ncbi:UNVERIFIED_CONTAM: Calnexin, partial [Eudyptes robustus]
MFGPDKCGPQSKIHFILKVANPINGTVSEHHAPQPKNIPDVTDKKTHLFTLKLRKNNDYEVLLDGNSLYYGSMMRDLQPPVQPPEEIADPDDKKPEDWDEREFINDPEAKKPDDWDEAAPKEIKPIIPNPAYKGPWSPPKIANPNFKGKWFPRIIKNPNYFEANPYQQLKTITALGFELWTIDKNIIFDNILITSDEALAAEFAAATFEVKKKYEE